MVRFKGEDLNTCIFEPWTAAPDSKKLVRLAGFIGEGHQQFLQSIIWHLLETSSAAIALLLQQAHPLGLANLDILQERVPNKMMQIKLDCHCPPPEVFLKLSKKLS